MAPLKQKEQRSRLTEIWLTASSGRSGSSSSACRRGKGIGQGHVTRTRNIGYILRLAGGGRLASQSPRPLKGGATLEGVDYFNLREESGTGEDKWLLRVTKTQMANTGRLDGWRWVGGGEGGCGTGQSHDVTMEVSGGQLWSANAQIELKKKKKDLRSRRKPPDAPL